MLRHLVKVGRTTYDVTNDFKTESFETNASILGKQNIFSRQKQYVRFPT